MADSREGHDRHPSVETLALLLEGGLENDRLRRELVPHLAAHCPVCAGVLGEIERAKREVGHSSEYVAVVERREAPALWERLASLSFREQVRAAGEDEELQAWGLCSLVLRKSLELASSDPATAAQAARLAAALVAALEPSYGLEALADLRALCLAALANAHRVLGELHAAADTFVETRLILDLGGTGDPRVGAEIAALEAALAYERRLFSPALVLYDQALALYSQIDLDERERRLPVEALAGKAACLRESGQLQEAITLLADTLERGMPDAGRDPALRDLLQRDLLLLLITVGRFPEAESLLRELAPRLSERGADRDRLRLQASAGLIAYGLRRAEEAERIIYDVKEKLLCRGMGYDAAIVALDLAVLYADQGRHDDLLRLSQRLVAVFESRAVHREAMAAVIMFRHACERQQLTVELARHLSGFLRRERLHTLYHPPPAGFPGHLGGDLTRPERLSPGKDEQQTSESISAS